MSKVSFIKSDDRKYNIERCLSLIKGEIMAGIRNAKRVVIKPNCVVDNNQLAATHVDSLAAVMEFIKPYVKSQIVLAEGVGEGSTIGAFQNYGYLKLQEKYDFTITDLNNDEFELIDLIDRNGKTWQAQVAKTVLDSDYLISVSPPKTHNTVVYTGAIKNVAVGPLLRPTQNFQTRLKSKLGISRNNKYAVHQGYAATNENIARLYKNMPPRLCILDAYEAMEGDGPISGEMVPAHFAIASSDPLAADWLACHLMGIDIKDVGYLSLLDVEDVEPFVIGDDWKENVSKFKMHSDFEKMRLWK